MHTFLIIYLSGLMISSIIGTILLFNKLYMEYMNDIVEEAIKQYKLENSEEVQISNITIIQAMHIFYYVLSWIGLLLLINSYIASKI